MRHLLFACLGLGLLVLAAAPAFAGELHEGEGYEIMLPGGFTEALSMSGNGTMKIESSIGMLPVDGVPETTVFVSGDLADPRGTIILARVNLKSGHKVESLDQLGMQQIEAMRSRLPEGLELKPRKVGAYDAIEMSMDMEMFDETHRMRLVTIAGGDFVMVVMMQTSETAFPAADAMWEQMLGSLKIVPGTNKLLLFGGIALGALFLIVLLKKLASGGSRAPGGFVEVTDWRSAVRTPAATPPGPETATARPTPSRTPVGAAGGGLQSTLAGGPGRPSTPGLGASTPADGLASRGRGAAPPVPAGRPGLRPTLPASGNWSDQVRN